jgi:DNA-binding transcriptional MerR regulator
MQFEVLAEEKKVNPHKVYYKIGEVAQLLDVKTSVLRFWEQEFHIKTQKTSTHQRIYDKKDIGKFIMIENLLYKQGFTLLGAKKQLDENKHEVKKHEELESIPNPLHDKLAKELGSLKEDTRKNLLHLRRELQTIVECLDE